MDNEKNESLGVGWQGTKKSSVKGGTEPFVNKKEKISIQCVVVYVCRVKGDKRINDQFCLSVRRLAVTLAISFFFLKNEKPRLIMNFSTEGH